MQYFNNDILCLEYDELVPDILSESNYKYHKQEGNIVVHGRGGNGSQVLIEYETMPEKHRKSVVDKYGDPYQYYIKQPIVKSVVWDDKAHEFYSRYVLPNGDKLPFTDLDLRGKPQINYVHRYTKAASWLNMLDYMTADKQAIKRELNISISQFWSTVVELMHTHEVHLPKDKAAKRLKAKLKDYKNNSYEVLVETHKFGNSFSSKISDEVAESILKEMIAHRNNHDDTVIAKVYNAWAKENHYPTITAGAVGYRRKKWRNELMLERDGLNKVNNILSKKIQRERPSAPLKLINSDDNAHDIYFINGDNKWYRPSLYVIIDAYNDYILGYAWGDTITKELVKQAFRNAHRHVQELTEGNYMWKQLQSDRWGISSKNTTELEHFYNSMGTFTPAALQAPQGKYIERSFGVLWHQVLKLMFPHNYSGYNLESKKKINRGKLNPSEFPDISQADEMIHSFITAMRNTRRKEDGPTRQQEWLNAFRESEQQQRILTEEQRLMIFGVPHSHINQITDNGVMATLGGQKVKYELTQQQIYEHAGKRVQVIYDEHDLRNVLLTDTKGLRLVAHTFDKVPSALDDYKPGDAERIKALQAEKKTLLSIMQKPIEERRAILQRAKIDAESRLKAGVITKEINHQDQRVLTAGATEYIEVMEENSTENEGKSAENNAEARGVRAKNNPLKSSKEPLKSAQNARNTEKTFFDEY